jgi:hypothetical protein
MNKKAALTIDKLKIMKKLNVLFILMLSILGGCEKDNIMEDRTLLELEVSYSTIDGEVKTRAIQEFGFVTGDLFTITAFSKNKTYTANYKYDSRIGFQNLNTNFYLEDINSSEFSFTINSYGKKEFVLNQSSDKDYKLSDYMEGVCTHKLDSKILNVTYKHKLINVIVVFQYKGNLKSDYLTFLNRLGSYNYDPISGIFYMQPVLFKIRNSSDEIIPFQDKTISTYENLPKYYQCFYPVDKIPYNGINKEVTLFTMASFEDPRKIIECNYIHEKAPAEGQQLILTAVYDSDAIKIIANQSLSDWEDSGEYLLHPSL